MGDCRRPASNGRQTGEADRPVDGPGRRVEGQSGDEPEDLLEPAVVGGLLEAVPEIAGSAPGASPANSPVIRANIWVAVTPRTGWSPTNRRCAPAAVTASTGPHRWLVRVPGRSSTSHPSSCPVLNTLPVDAGVRAGPTRPPGSRRGCPHHLFAAMRATSVTSSPTSTSRSPGSPNTSKRPTGPRSRRARSWRWSTKARTCSPSSSNGNLAGHRSCAPTRPGYESRESALGPLGVDGMVHLYHLDTKRGVEAMGNAGILDLLTGVLVHDGWTPYRHYTELEHQLCNAHHLRELQAATETGVQPWAADMAGLLTNTWKAVLAAMAAGNTTFTAAQIKTINTDYDQIIAAGYDTTPEPAPTGTRGRPNGPSQRTFFSAWTRSVPTSSGSPPTSISRSTTTSPYATSGWSKSTRKSPAGSDPKAPPPSSPPQLPLPARKPASAPSPPRHLKGTGHAAGP